MEFDASHLFSHLFTIMPEAVEAVRRALIEDIGAGDLTTELCIPRGVVATGQIVARQALVLAGSELVPVIFEELAPAACTVDLLHRSGDRLHAGEEIAFV